MIMKLSNSPRPCHCPHLGYVVVRRAATGTGIPGRSSQFRVGQGCREQDQRVQRVIARSRLRGRTKSRARLCVSPTATMTDCQCSRAKLARLKVDVFFVGGAGAARSEGQLHMHNQDDRSGARIPFNSAEWDLGRRPGGEGNLVGDRYARRDCSRCRVQPFNNRKIVEAGQECDQ